MATHVIGAAGRASTPRFGRIFGEALKRVQAARMQSVLYSLSDADLQRIGMTRREIPEQAWRLVNSTR